MLCENARVLRLFVTIVMPEEEENSVHESVKFSLSETRAGEN